MANGKVILLTADMCDHLDRVTCLPARGGEMSDYGAGCLLGQRGCGHSQSSFDTRDQEAVQ